jgi:hypothetical protein
VLSVGIETPRESHRPDVGLLFWRSSLQSSFLEAIFLELSGAVPARFTALSLQGSSVSTSSTVNESLSDLKLCVTGSSDASAAASGIGGGVVNETVMLLWTNSVLESQLV